MYVDFPRKLQPLFQPYRFKSLRGGRDGGKSWGCAQTLVEIASAPERTLRDWGLWCGTPEFVVCARENMNSIADSVHRLLEQTIHRLELESMWQIEKAGMKNHRTAAEFVFRGLRNPDALKSLEGATRGWVEEAQGMSAESWRKIPPTLRRDNSELWLTWNPELETDPTWKHLVTQPPPGLLDIQINYSDNPWRSKVLDAERAQMERDDPDEFAHVWRGQPRRQMAGAIYANEIRLCEQQGRIGAYPFNPALPVDTGWDLGDSDLCCIWFFQRSMGQYRAIDYLEDNHKPLSYYLGILEAKGYRYGKDYFPWDASSKMLVGSLEETMRQRGRTVVVMPRQPRAAGIDAVRELLGTCWFNEQTTEDGVNRLRYYRQAPTKIIDPVTHEPVMSMQPIHDQNCFHPHTLVLTRNGTRRIMDIGQNEAVLTPCGFKPAQKARVTRRNALLVEVTFTDGLTVRCTPDHLFLTANGWKSAESLTSTSLIQSTLTRSHRISLAVSIACGRVSGICQGLAGGFIGMCGRLHSAIFPQVAISTIATGTASTTGWITSNAFPSVSTFGTPGPSAGMLSRGRLQGQERESGINHQREGFGINGTPKNQRAGSTSSAKRSLARTAALRLTHWSARVARSLSAFARTPARPLRIASVKPLSERLDTWCIAVEDGHWFSLSNGAVVHNSHGADALRTIAMGYKRPVQVVRPKTAQPRKAPLSAWS